MFSKRKQRKATEEAARIVGLHLYRNVMFSEGTIKIVGLRDKWARGYMFGAMDAVFQEFSIEHESEEGIAVMISTFSVLMKLSKEDAVSFFWQCVEMQDDLEFSEGVLCGGAEMLLSLDGVQYGVLGLGRYLRDGTKTVHAS